jgi:5-methylcytosine-specific restriction endonuclease McrA
MMGKKINYRKIAFGAYDPLCAHCGFGIPAVLEVAHIDGNRQNNEARNLVILCPNCHKMHDLDLISTETIIQMRDRPKTKTVQIATKAGTCARPNPPDPPLSKGGQGGFHPVGPR